MALARIDNDRGREIEPFVQDFLKKIVVSCIILDSFSFFFLIIFRSISFFRWMRCNFYFFFFFREGKVNDRLVSIKID